MNPFDDDTERRLRESLARHAGDADRDADLLAERIVHAADRARHGRATGGRSRRALALPVAVAALVLVIAGVVVGITQLGGSSDPAPPVAARSTAPSSSATPARHVVAPATTTHTPQATTSGASTPLDTTTLHGVRVVDLTFTGADSGWALATADCLTAAGSRCTALLHTSNGRTWQSRPGAQFNVPGVTGGCSAPCVTGIRFADDDTGYAYGPSALFMTTDGGMRWQQQTGGAEALETLDGNVVRVTSSGSGCPGPCGIGVQTAGIGSMHWIARDLGRPAQAATAAVQLVRGGSNAYLLATRNPAGGADTATSTLYRSGDNGSTWTTAGEPCPQTRGEADSVAVAAGAGDTLTALCRVRQGGAQFVVTSRDAGRGFERGGALPATAGSALVGDPDTVLLVTHSGDSGSGGPSYRNTGSGWTAVPTLAGVVDFAGFESETVGRAVVDSGTKVATTRNAGASWTEVALG